MLNPGLSKLCHLDDCSMGLLNHVEKRKQYGKFFLPGLLGHMSCGSGSGLGSTLYTRHQHHVAPKFCADVVFRRRLFLSLVYLEAGTRRAGVEELTMILPPWSIERERVGSLLMWF